MRRANKRWASVVLLLGLTACNTEIFVSGDGAGGSDSGNDNSSSVNTTSTSSGGQACVVGKGYFEMALQTHDAYEWSCNQGFSTMVGSISFRGTVVKSDATGFSVELCPPTADCLEEQINTVSYNSADMRAVVAEGSFVDVAVTVDQPWGCSHAISVVNVPSWYGVQNPVTSDPLIWLAAADGTTTVLHPDVEIHTPKQDCEVADVGCGDLSKAYGLRFASAEANKGVTLLPGEQGLWEISSQVLSVTALRAFESGCPDDYWDWGYTITQAQIDF